MSESEYRTFEALALAADIAIGQLAKHERLRVDFRKTARPNPLFHQLACGLCLELAQNGAVHFWTPWGDWNPGLASPNAFDGRPEFDGLTFSDFSADAAVCAPASPSRVFAIHQCKNLILPQPVPRPLAAYRPPAEIQRRWPELANLLRARRRFAA
jgi:hypothetical protein